MVPLWLLMLMQQAVEPRIERLSILDGLSQSQVLAIAQDHEGFLWFGTQDGLNRYDGYHFQIFRDDSEEKPLSDNHIQSLLVDANNTLWIGTKEGGLMAWDLNTGVFATFRHNPADETSLGSDNVWSLYEDHQKRLWAGTLGGGLNLWQPEAYSFQRFLSNSKDSATLSNNHIRSMLQDENGVFWVGTDQGLNRRNPGEKGFIQYLHDPNDPNSLNKGNIFALSVALDGQIWLGSIGGGVSRFDPVQEHFTHFRHDPNQPKSLSNDRVWSLFHDSENQLWVGTMDRGLNLWDPVSGGFKKFKNTRYSKGLSSNKIWSIFEDRSGILWLGTGDQGVNKLNHHAKPFFHVPKVNEAATISENLVIMALAPTDSDIWVGTWGQGLFKMNAEGDFTKLPLAAHASGSPRLFVSLYAENKAELWMGIWGQGLVRLDVDTMEETSYRWHFGAQKPSLNVTQIKPFGQRLLLTTYGDGVVVFDPGTETFSRFEDEDGPLPQLSTGNFFCTFQSTYANQLQTNEVWFGTVGKGLYRLDLATNSLKTYQKEAGKHHQLPSNRITLLYQDSADRFWVGTDGGGLAQYLPDTDQFRRITTKTGLPSNVINGVIEGPSGNLWVATNKGLDFFDPNAGTHRIFGPDDGVQLEFNAGVYAAMPSGFLFFGGPKGLDFFDPTEIKQNPYIPPVVLSQFKVFNQPRQLPKPLNKTRVIELKYTDNFFAFEFASMDFSNPQKNRFKVQLEGIDKGWVHNGTRNYKEYTNLKGGTYTFKVQGSNGDGVWNELGPRIKVRIIPPFWETQMFLISAGLVLLMATIATVHFFERKKIVQLELRQKEQWELSKRLAEAREGERVQIAQEIHDGPIQDLHAIQFQMSLAKEKNDYSNIGKYLLSVISSLRRLCGHLRPPALIPFGLAAAIRSLVDTLRDKYPDVMISLNLENDGQKIPEDVRLALFRICQEALNNALQHSHGRIVKVLFKVDRLGLHLTISDDGRGFELAENLLAFSSNGHYGLLGMTERVQSIGGKVAIKTGPGLGTRVKVLIPRGKALHLEAAAYA